MTRWSQSSIFEGFGWKLSHLQPKKLFFFDAQPRPDLIQAGNFDLSGMLAGLQAQIKLMRARRIVFDAMDILLALLPDAPGFAALRPAGVVRERTACRAGVQRAAENLTYETFQNICSIFVLEKFQSRR